jgi:hypothetical protein
VADITRLDADKKSDVVYYQRHVIGNFIELLAEIRAQFVDLAARHDVWTAEMKAEARQAPKDEAALLQRVWAFLRGRDEFEEELSDITCSADHQSVQAGRRSPGKQLRDQIAEHAPRPPRPPMPEWSTLTTAASSASTATFASTAPAARRLTWITSR